MCCYPHCQLEIFLSPSNATSGLSKSQPKPRARFFQILSNGYSTESVGGQFLTSPFRHHWEVRALLQGGRGAKRHPRCLFYIQLESGKAFQPSARSRAVSGSPVQFARCLFGRPDHLRVPCIRKNRVPALQLEGCSHVLLLASSVKMWAFVTDSNKPTKQKKEWFVH